MCNARLWLRLLACWQRPRRKAPLAFPGHLTLSGRAASRPLFPGYFAPNGHFKQSGGGPRRFGADRPLAVSVVA